MTDAQIELAADGRGLIELIRTFDGPADVAAAASAHLAAAAALLEPHRWRGPYEQRMLRSERTGDMAMFEGPVASFFPYSPVIGVRNPMSPPAVFSIDTEPAGEDSAMADHHGLRGEVTFGAAAVGPPSSVHGGMIALLFDELLGCTAVSNGLGAHTGTLKIVYRSLTPAGETLSMRSWFAGQERRKIFIGGELYVGDRLCAEAEGIFVRAAGIG